MSIQVTLHHRTTYRYERPIQLGPQSVRLKPAPHCRTPILSYSQKVTPAKNFCNWQQDPQGNFVARYVFPERTEVFEINVSLVADLAVINPFDFFVDEDAEFYPFQYESGLASDLRPYLRTNLTGPVFEQLVAGLDRGRRGTVDLLMDLNRLVQAQVGYTIRMEPGVQTPEQTLQSRSGSCRDSAWLLIHVLRRLGIAARFVSGYLIQLAADMKSLDGPSGPEADFTDLHAWAEAYVPGAGWIGLDPTSGLMCGEGHIPLASTPEPATAAPISGAIEHCRSEFDFSMTLKRLPEAPRSTRPYSDGQWQAIDRLGDEIDGVLRQEDVRLTVGGEPTFVSIDDMEGAEWNGAAVGPAKRRLSGELVKRLRRRFASGGLLHYGQGKWYPGEPLPRWALACLWRADGQPLWHDEELIANEDKNYGHTYRDAHRFTERLAVKLGVDPQWLVPAFEDPVYYLWRERRLPIDVRPTDPKLDDPEERARMMRVFSGGMTQPVGIVLPLRRVWSSVAQQAQQQQALAGNYRWTSGPWPVRADQLFLLPGDSPIGLRLPLDALPTPQSRDYPTLFPTDPFEPPVALPASTQLQRQFQDSGATVGEEANVPSAASASTATTGREEDFEGAGSEEPKDGEIVRTAMCVEPRDGRLYVFMPPLERLEDYVELVAAVESTAADLRMPIVIEGYLPPGGSQLKELKVTPDPGVIEVNVHPTDSWSELKEIITGIYDDARQTRLGTEKFDLDGRHTGTGGGNHIVMGGRTPADSPFLRRPDLLRSLIAYWVNHPSLSYLFGSRFCGPTSQSPRVDEGRRDAMYELQMALDALPLRGHEVPPWIVDRVLRNLLIDLTGNTHRAEICIDKLFSPDSAAGRLGLVELRAFEMPPHAQMSLSTHLLLRGLIAMFWQRPYTADPIEWGLDLHDRFMLPHFLREDIREVITDLQSAGFAFDPAWYQPHYEFRLPHIGRTEFADRAIDLRTAIEPWYVLGEEPGGGGTVRYVDSSVERLELMVEGFDPDRHKLLVNGLIAPLHPTRVSGRYVCGVRYRAWQPPSCLHPTIPVQTPLTFDWVDGQAGLSLFGCTYHVSHPAGRNYQSFPINSLEAEARRAARFQTFGTPAAQLTGRLPRPNPDFPLTLDLRREYVRPH